MVSDKLTIGLLSHYFQDTNLGCSALSICNVLFLDQVAKELGIEVEYKILVNEKQPHGKLLFMSSKYEYRVFPSTKQVLKHPLRLIKTKVFQNCDIIFNLCAGDGFTDIYGKYRTFSESYMVIMGYMKGYEMILAPQTIGPFSNIFCRIVAKQMMNCCRYIFVRDRMSYDLCCELGQKLKTREVIDVALALPFTEVKLCDLDNVGINVSGLLYNDKKNRFSLTINYKHLVHEIVEELIALGYKVHLISHVIISNGMGEDDFSACESVHKSYPNTILVKKFESPIEVKSYIAGLDLFIGARMHATIAAISSGVPVIPIAYSRKVNGLYGNLNYPYFIDAKDEHMNNVNAIAQFKNYLNSIDDMNQCIRDSKKIYKNLLDEYKNALRVIFSERIV